jgi:hypothetical protein
MMTHDNLPSPPPPPPPSPPLRSLASLACFAQVPQVHDQGGRVPPLHEGDRRGHRRLRLHQDGLLHRARVPPAPVRASEREKERPSDTSSKEGLGRQKRVTGGRAKKSEATPTDHLRQKRVTGEAGEGLLLEKRASEGVVGGRPPEPPPRPARSHMRSVASACARPHMPPQPTCGPPPLPH